MDEIQQYENSVKRVDVLNEFLSAFADKGVVFTDQEIEIIFTRFATRINNVINQIDKEETQ